MAVKAAVPREQLELPGEKKKKDEIPKVEAIWIPRGWVRKNDEGKKDDGSSEAKRILYGNYLVVTPEELTALGEAEEKKRDSYTTSPKEQLLSELRTIAVQDWHGACGIAELSGLAVYVPYPDVGKKDTLTKKLLRTIQMIRTASVGAADAIARYPISFALLSIGPYQQTGATLTNVLAAGFNFLFSYNNWARYYNRSEHVKVYGRSTHPAADPKEYAEFIKKLVVYKDGKPGENAPPVPKITLKETATYGEK